MDARADRAENAAVGVFGRLSRSAALRRALLAPTCLGTKTRRSPRKARRSGPRTTRRKLRPMRRTAWKTPKAMWVSELRTRMTQPWIKLLLPSHSVGGRAPLGLAYYPRALSLPPGRRLRHRRMPLPGARASEQGRGPAHRIASIRDLMCCRSPGCGAGLTSSASSSSGTRKRTPRYGNITRWRNSSSCINSTWTTARIQLRIHAPRRPPKHGAPPGACALSELARHWLGRTRCASRAVVAAASTAL